MAPAQVIEPKDLPPEVGVTVGESGDATFVQPVVAAFSSESVPKPQSVCAPSDALPASVPYIVPVLQMNAEGWELGLEADAIALLATGRTDVWDELTRRFESRLILAALGATRGRRIEAAQKLGIGRNTITRKIQELGLE
jgi:two-component system, NtrC family, nitrogen regulation response regulator GlnG